MSDDVLTEEKKELTKQYKQLLKISYRTLSAADKKLIRSAFDVAVDAHKDQRRKSGEAYVFHPIAVAKIVASEIGLDATSIAAALLHDVVEDTDYTLADLEQLFGETVARIVDGLTKISNMPYDGDVSLQAENFRKMLLICMPEHKQVKIASETLYIYAPLAHRIGLYNIKTQLEDLGLKYTEPNVYQDILSRIKESKEEQDAYIEDFTNTIKNSLDAEGLQYEITFLPL